MRTRLARYPWITIVLPIAMAVLWVACSGYQGLNGQDAHDYLRIARAWTAWTHGAAMPAMAEHPHGYPVAGALFGMLVGDELIALRIISLAGLYVIVFVYRNMLRRAFPTTVHVEAYVLLAFATAPFLLRYSFTALSDVPCMALLALSFACSVRWITHGGVKWLCAAVLMALLALGVRLAVAPMLIVLGVAWVIGPVDGRVLRMRLAIAGAVLLVLVVLLTGFPLATMGTPLEDWSMANLFRLEQLSDDGVLRYAFPNLIYVCGIVVHPGTMPIGILLLPFVRKVDLHTAHARLALALLVCYLLFIAGMPFQNDRVLLLAQPFVALLLYPAFTRAMAWLVAKRLQPRWFIGAAMLVQMALFVRALLPFMHQTVVERELAATVNGLHADHVYTHGMGAAFSTYCPGIEVTELWYAEVPRFIPGALVVVHPANLADQWQGRPPWINWQQVNEQGTDILLQRTDGWVIARVR